jgi:(p)ppGpp synthase/HD superfamily hydrolase
MSEISEYTIAHAIAKSAHANQFRKDGITPYFDHPVAVANLVRKYRVVAILHDVLEDNPKITPELLLEQEISKENVEAVILLTRKENEDYFEYLNKIKQNPIARKVKIADICHNLTDDPSRKQVEKYIKALLFLYGQASLS